jgi:hypothetical protein
MQLNESFGSGLSSAGVSPVILRAFTPRETTGGTPAPRKTCPAAMKCIIPVTDTYRREKCGLTFPSCPSMIFAAA